MANHYKFIENNLIRVEGETENIDKHLPLAFRSGRSNEPNRNPTARPVETHHANPGTGVKSIFSDSNMEIQIQIYGNLFPPISLINHGYAGKF